MVATLGSDPTQTVINGQEYLECFASVSTGDSDLPDLMGVHEKKLIQYTYPSGAELKDVGVTGIFLGYYFSWDGKINADIASKHGFTTYHKNVEGSIKHHTLDGNLVVSYHQKWLGNQSGHQFSNF